MRFSLSKGEEKPIIVQPEETGYGDLELKCARYQSKCKDLMEENERLKKTERAVKAAIGDAWKALVQINEVAKHYANKYDINPFDHEHSQNLGNMEVLVQAFANAYYFDRPESKEGYRKLSEQLELENHRRKNAETALKVEKEKVAQLETKLREPVKEEKKINITVVPSKITFKKVEVPVPEEVKEVETAAQDAAECEEHHFVQVLKEQNVKVLKSKNPMFDIHVVYDKQGTNEDIPLRYFDKPPESHEEFGHLMEQTDNIIMLYPDKESKLKGGSQFTKWLLLSQRRQKIRFSILSFEDVQKNKGLKILSRL